MKKAAAAKGSVAVPFPVKKAAASEIIATLFAEAHTPEVPKADGAAAPLMKVAGPLMKVASPAALLAIEDKPPPKATAAPLPAVIVLPDGRLSEAAAKAKTAFPKPTNYEHNLWMLTSRWSRPPRHSDRSRSLRGIRPFPS